MAISSTLPIKSFSAWLTATFRADREGADMEVPCGDCRGCCTTSYFIHIAPDETAALGAIGWRGFFGPDQSLETTSRFSFSG